MQAPKVEVKWQPANGYGFYWHLLDSQGTIRAWSGQGFGRDHQKCVADAQAAVAAMRDGRLTIVNAY